MNSLANFRLFSCILRYFLLYKSRDRNLNSIFLCLFKLQPNPKKLPKMDSVAYETFGTTSMDDGGEDGKDLDDVQE